MQEPIVFFVFFNENQNAILILYRNTIKFPFFLTSINFLSMIRLTKNKKGPGEVLPKPGRVKGLSGEVFRVLFILYID